MNTLKITKDLFLETITAVEKQYRHDETCAKAFATILPSDFTTTYDNHVITNQLTKLLQIAMKDNHKHSWIEYFMYERNFGKAGRCWVTNNHKKYNLNTAEDLWNLLVDQPEET